MDQPTIMVLLVEADPRFARTVKHSLAEFTTARIELTVSGCLKQALHDLRQGSFEAVLVDLNLPDSEGLSAFSDVQAQAPSLPIVILADFDNEAVAVRAVRNGAQDYLVKSRFEGRFLSRVIRYAIERKRTEEALRESEQRYRRLVASTTDYIYTVKVENGVSHLASHGPACATVTGYTAEEYAADPDLWYRMIFEEDRPAVTEQITRLLSGQAVPPLEHRVLHKNGCLCWVRNTAVAHQDSRGRVMSYDGLISDITERKQAERRLAAQYAVTRALAEAASLGEAARRILHTTCNSLAWDLGVFWAGEPRSPELRCVATWSRPGGTLLELEAALARSGLAKGDGLFGHVWRSGTPSGVQDPSDDRVGFDQVALASGAGVRASCGFPIAIDGQVLGVIGLFSTRTHPAEDVLLEMMGTVGGQIGQFMLRKQAEEVLAEERNLLRTLIDTLPDAIYVKDTESRFVLGNLAVTRLMGASRAEDLCGRTDAEFYPADLAVRYYADERRVLESGQPLINREEPVIDAGGGQGWLLTTKAPLRDLRGRVIGLVGIGRDVTQRRKDEEAHRLIEARLQAILANTTAVIYVKDPQGRYQLINRQFERLFGVTSEQVVHQTDFQLFPAETAGRLQANDQKVLETRAAQEFEEMVPCSGGARTYISIKFPLSDAEGTPYAVCGISSDITERKGAEQALRESQERLQLALEGADLGLWDWNVASGEVFLNDRWLGVLGYSRADFAGGAHTWQDMVHPEDLARVTKVLRSHLDGASAFYETEHRCRTKAGEDRWVLQRGRVVARDATGQPTRMAGTHLDITERKRAETQLVQTNLELVEANLHLSQGEETLRRTLSELRTSHDQLKTTQLQLIQAAKLESIGTLAAGVAHEVKNPLQTILMGVAYLSRGSAGVSGQGTMVLTEMREAIKRADSIVRGLVEFSSCNHPEVQDEAINSIVEESLSLLKYELTKQRVTVVKTLAPGLPLLKLEKDKIQQAFINLFLNAIQAMPEGGTLTVRTFAKGVTRVRTETGAGPASAASPEDPAVVVEVEDTGVGIPRDKLPRIFDPFFTTKAPGVGTGLGLPVTRKIIELHGGTIDVANRDTGGARFSIAFKNEPKTDYEPHQETSTHC